MSDILEEFWIFSKEGEAIVNFYRDPKANGSFNYRDVSLDQAKLNEIGVLILSSFQNSTQDKQKIMRIENNLFTYGHCLQNNLVLFYKTNPKIKEKKVLIICKVISDILENAYPLEKLKLWGGNLSFFEKFRKKIAIYFKMSSL